MSDLEKAGPFGSGNPEPVFVFPSHRIVAGVVTSAARPTAECYDGAAGLTLRGSLQARPVASPAWR